MLVPDVKVQLSLWLRSYPGVDLPHGKVDVALIILREVMHGNDRRVLETRLDPRLTQESQAQVRRFCLVTIPIGLP